MRNIIISLSVILFSIGPLSAQLTSFELDNIESDNFKQNVEPLFKSISLASNSHFIIPININKRFSFGISYTLSTNLTDKRYSTDRIGGYPNVGSALIITDNLLLKGNLSIFKSGSDIVQSFGYGFGLDLTKKEKNNWRLSALFSQLRGPDDLKNRSIDAVIIRETMIRSFPFFIGVGLNKYNTKLLIDNEFIQKSFKGNAHYLSTGTRLTLGNIIFIPVLQVNSSVTTLTIEILGNFK